MKLPNSSFLITCSFVCFVNYTEQHFILLKKNDVVGHVFDDDKITYSSSMPTLVMMYHQILKTDISRTGHLTVVI